ncbi:DMT family transporter [Shimia aestuarii]|uniref:DMT family transporter n=1 Tax=Shimia aestuarii TaxID=254406 RepID=UPI001FB341A0|nr:DMT family transporter [Shimia aestuarii]
MSSTSPNPVRPIAVGGTRRTLSGNALGVASMFAWACGFPAAEVLLATWPTLALITARFALAVTMLMVLWLLVDGPRAVASARWGRGTLIGGLTFGLGTYLLLLAQSLTDAVTVAIIATGTPIAATLIEMWSGGRRLNTAFVLGMIASVAGGVIATGGTGVETLGAGVLAALGSCFLFALGSHFTVRDFSDLSPVGRTTITLAGGLVFNATIFLVAYAIGTDVLPRAVIDTHQITMLAIYALAAGALSQVMWIASVGRLGIAVASFHINVAPFYVMLLMLALGDGWNWTKACGAGIVILGVIIAQRGETRRVAA